MYYMIGLVLVIWAMLFSMYAQYKVNKAYKSYQKVSNSRNMSGYEVAREILDSHGMQDVVINEVAGELSDHFNQKDMTINLSSDIYHGRSISSMAIAAHECGHAIQWHENYVPIKIRDSIAPACIVGNNLGWVSIMIGFLMRNYTLAWVGLFLSLGILAFQLVTLPVEFDASKRGLQILENNYLTSSEVIDAREVLSGAALTYVAATLATIASLLRIALILLGSRDD